MSALAVSESVQAARDTLVWTLTDAVAEFETRLAHSLGRLETLEEIAAAYPQIAKNLAEEIANVRRDAASLWVAFSDFCRVRLNEDPQHSLRFTWGRDRATKLSEIESRADPQRVAAQYWKWTECWRAALVCVAEAASRRAN